jgi:hypothetical protein
VKMRLGESFPAPDADWIVFRFVAVS